MKHFRKVLSFLLMGVALLGLTGCDGNIAKKVNESVTIPDQYSITYEVETPVGKIKTVQKVQDSDGNVFFRSGAEELLFIKDGNLYALYEKDASGQYVARGMQAAYNAAYVDSVTAEFLNYTDRSKQKFLPGMKENGEQEILGRTCLTYSIAVGTESTGVTYSFYVDKETGICMGWDENKLASGYDLGVDGEVFCCTEFTVEDIPSLKTLIDDFKVE